MKALWTAILIYQKLIMPDDIFGAEYHLEKLKEVQSGYMNGHLKNPTYAQIVSHTKRANSPIATCM